jgi:hypothetical protein
VLKLDRRRGSIACTGQNRESNERLIAPLDLGARRQRADHMPDLFKRRHSFLAPRFGDSGFLARQIEILGITI